MRSIGRDKGRTLLHVEWKGSSNPTPPQMLEQLNCWSPKKLLVALLAD